MTHRLYLLPVLALLMVAATPGSGTAHTCRIKGQGPAPPADSTLRRIVVVDAETGQRVRGALIGCGSHRDTTAWDGTATLPARFAEATVSRVGYLTRHLSTPLSTDTLTLIPSAHRLAEVEVWGRRGRKDLLQRSADRRLTEQLIANEGTARGFNPLGLVAWGIKKLLPRHPRLTRQEKQKIVMDHY